MSELDQLLNIAKTDKKQPLWKTLLSRLEEIEKEKEEGKSYKEMAEGLEVSEVAFSRALKRARAEAPSEKESDVNFAPILPEVEEMEITIEDEINREQESKQQDIEIKQVQVIDTEHLERLEQLMIELNELKNNVVDVATEEASEQISRQIMEINLATEKAKAHTEKYANDARKYVDKVIAQSLNTIVKKSALTIEKKLQESNKEISKQKSKYKPDKWVAVAFVSCLFIVGGGYYAGTNNNEHMREYRAAKSNEAKWAEFVKQWQKATDEEKKAVEKMMSR
jgi:hypothetical protein